MFRNTNVLKNNNNNNNIKIKNIIKNNKKWIMILLKIL